ncbi:hypothetical protein [Chondromyces crocatus]|uniref:Restriction endonuclease type IV Mrr domain-containing protein n=1 Tax=Chondromyces crocatus TaxID=52 RepID=A0A0K1EGQ6_CHOCO|nr:hypothetical protein [Chondromyces crocatus]AKT39768.1 uncharacterized protein CMC5_039190 [Chondromyces crocatus]
MLTNDWVEFIKNVLSPSAFNEVALATLRALYGTPVLLADGTGDGGADAWIEFQAGRKPVQLHSGLKEAWDVKLSGALDRYELLRTSGRLFFVCAQTPAAPEPKLAQLEMKYGVVIKFYDARSIASLAAEPDRYPEVYAVLARIIGASAARATPRPWSPSVDARLAFTFFHENSGDFRAEVARSVLAACLYRTSTPISVDALLSHAVDAAGIGTSVRRLFRRELDTLAAEGLVEVREAEVAATRTLAARTKAALDIQAAAAERLREDCIEALEGRIHDAERRRSAVDDVFDDLGLLVREVPPSALTGRTSEELTRRLDRVERRLADHLMPRGGTSSEALKELVDVVSASPYGKALGAAELFIQMTSRESDELATALTHGNDLTIWLDASVALPMLCGMFDRVAHGWTTSESAVELHQALRKRGIMAVIPSVYIEEMAAHLLEAARRYRSFIGVDEDLARSENFYVAHFHAVAQRRSEPATLVRFDEFLQDLGLPHDWESDRWSQEPRRLRRVVEQSLETLAKRYEIGSQRIVSTEAVALQDEPRRSDIVLRHDRCVARELEEKVGSAGGGVLLCSEDQWFIGVLAAKQLLALHPAALLDVVQIVRPRDEPRRLASMRELAATFSERALSRGAAVWDLLAQLEAPQLSDRELLRRAKDFKSAWLRRTNRETLPRAADWQRFKVTGSFDA